MWSVLVSGTYKSMGNTNLVATVWKDNRDVWALITNSRPDAIVATNCQISQRQAQVNQPENVAKYNMYVSGVDRHDQMHVHYNVGYFVKKAWKYLMWFFVNVPLVNAYILVACKLIGGFSSRKRKHEAPLYVGPIAAANEGNHENIHVEAGRFAMQCKWHLMQKRGRKMTAFGCKLCGVHLCKEGCHYAYHNQ